MVMGMFAPMTPASKREIKIKLNNVVVFFVMKKARAYNPYDKMEPVKPTSNKGLRPYLSESLPNIGEKINCINEKILNKLVANKPEAPSFATR